MSVPAIFIGGPNDGKRDVLPSLRHTLHVPTFSKGIVLTYPYTHRPVFVSSETKDATCTVSASRKTATRNIRCT